MKWHLKCTGLLVSLISGQGVSIAARFVSLVGVSFVSGLCLSGPQRWAALRETTSCKFPSFCFAYNWAQHCGALHCIKPNRAVSNLTQQGGCRVRSATLMAIVLTLLRMRCSSSLPRRANFQWSGKRSIPHHLMHGQHEWPVQHMPAWACSAPQVCQAAGCWRQ